MRTVTIVGLTIIAKAINQQTTADMAEFIATIVIASIVMDLTDFIGEFFKD